MSQPDRDLPADVIGLVADVADEFQARQSRGEDPDPEEYAARHPHAAGEIRGVLAILRMGALTGSDAGTGPTSEVAGAAADTGTRPGPPTGTDGLPRAGDTFGGFEIRGELGRGGMGAVFRAFDRDLGRLVALKVMLPAVAARSRTRDRFAREARALAAVHHDHICPVFQVSEDHGAPFLVMPLLVGETLAARLTREAPLPPAEVVRIGGEIAHGLAALHATGLVHRDLKPANIWLEAPTGRVKLLDLGLARDPSAGDGVTTEGAVLGTPAYMSPEQANGNPVDARSDLFSLGSVLYEAATGRPAFAGTSLTAVLAAVGEKELSPARAVNPAVPARLSDLIARLHHKQPTDRPVSAAIVAAELARPSASTTAGPGGRLVPLVAAAVVLVAFGGLLAWLAIRSDRSPGVATDPASGPAPTPDLVKPAVPPVTVPLRVVDLSVRHSVPAGADVQPFGAFGADSFGAMVGDEIDVIARLSRPGYAYVILFRADGQDAVLYPQDDADVPGLTDRPLYPSTKRDERYALTEGTGLWAVAVVASADPLPAYRDWRAKHPGGPWKTFTGQRDVVWRDDGQWLESLVAGRAAVRGTRGKVEAKDKAPMVGLVDWLRDEVPGAAVWAVGFTVEPRK